MVTFLEDGQASGNLRLIANATVEKVILDGGRAVGVLATVTVSQCSPPRLAVGTSQTSWCLARGRNKPNIVVTPLSCGHK
jgi:hypothetical protein